MAKLEYAKDGRLLFTKEMKEEYTILMPMMIPVTFELLASSLKLEGYKIELLTTTHRGIVEEGLKTVHNDTCYPALLVIGQLIDALKSGKYDLNKVALIITQTGGGCRASNYIHLLRKALKKNGYDHIPVISLNINGFEKNPGFKLSLNVARQAIFAILYGDLINCLSNQCRPYEIEEGMTNKLVDKWLNLLTEEFKDKKNLEKQHIRNNFYKIAADFAAVPIKREPKVKVGIVGEIYIKYARLGNNCLEDFLHNEGVEVVVPGLLDFLIFKLDNRIVDVVLYGGNKIKKLAMEKAKGFLERWQEELIAAISHHEVFRVPESFEHIKELVKGYLGYGNKMGEGWLLTGEMLELIQSGVNNVICTQPFGCLPNHIVGKGMIRKIKDNLPQANIVAIDYDPGATRINQENRIKLMLANAYQALTDETA